MVRDSAGGPTLLPKKRELHFHGAEGEAGSYELVAPNSEVTLWVRVDKNWRELSSYFAAVALVVRLIGSETKWRCLIVNVNEAT